ncbi:methylated-DNA--[protein]-cysteine S-methyltransferase [Raoultella ornithinolytica]|uniref:methylated-DNA--[protein]-cysteine S-methyltransferase n=1 Tax=Raoultella ornithinolytica TaxID=54291 RepID=UPI00084A1343|nr:methylated-DNA--[protein]-cysteine S-methyltransferase [Raoultella ornithinolytica]
MSTYSENIHYAMGLCTLGNILVASSEKGICAIFLGDDGEAVMNELRAAYPRAQLTDQQHTMQSLLEKVVAFIDTPETGVTFGLDIRGTDFQQRVWQALIAIPAGETRTYQQIATALGDADAVRAVAGACAANVLAVAVPCHRVVRKDGSLSGYRWGIERKRQLLDLEARA